VLELAICVLWLASLVVCTSVEVASVDEDDPSSSGERMPLLELELSSVVVVDALL